VFKPFLKEDKMDKKDIISQLKSAEDAINKAYDEWYKILESIRGEFEKLFVVNQGVGNHLYGAWSNIQEINDDDIDEIIKKVGI
jgi:hypothetical protein